MPLSSKQRAHLRGLAHAEKPLLHVGKDGVTEAAVEAVREAFHRRELLKLRVLDGAPVSAREAASAITDALTDVEVVQVMGRNVTLYQPHPTSPTIRLPR